MTTTAVAALLCLAGPALAQSPTGGNVVAGSAAISQAGNATNIHQSTGKAIIDWQGFSVGAQNSVNFHQPGASSVTLNRVIGNEASVINGAINANGQVFIVNSAGVLFGKGAQVNVGGLVASTHDISNSDFMAGRYTFSGTSNAAVINQGRIRAHGGGYVALLGKTVSNEGVISARLGTVAMSAGEKLTLNFEGNSLLDVTIDKGALNALVSNKRAIIADGGRVILTARAADQVLAAQVNNTGIVQARTIAALKGGSAATGRKGRRTAPKAKPDSNPDIDPADVPMAQENVKGNIKIYAYGGTANIAGKLDASALKGGDGGFIETSGDVVNVADGTRVTTLSASGKAGLWLIDPNDFTVAASGGNMTAATVVSNLATTPFEIRTATMGTPGGNGDIFINEAITWSSNTTLTLTAERNVNINQAITARGASAGLVLNAGHDININNAVTLEGATATLAMNFGHDYNIRTSASYAGVADEMGPIYDKNGKPVLDKDGKQVLGPVAKQNTSGGVYGSVKFSTCVDTASCGTRLKINNVDYTLIGSMAQLDALDGMNAVDGSGTAISVTGNYALARNLEALGTTYTRALLGTGTGPTANRVAFSGTLTGLGHTISNLTIDDPTTSGTVYTGLIGYGKNAVLRDIGLVDVNVNARVGKLGSLAGEISGSIYNAYSTGQVNRGGGLVGTINGVTQSSVVLSYAYSEVNGGAGGLADSVSGGSISHVHATGNVSVGGLFGSVNTANVSYAYATGAVAGSSTSNGLGGLIGSIALNVRTSPSISLTNSFATGDVTGGTFLGGLVGKITRSGPAQTGTITIDNVYATGNVTGGYSDIIQTGDAIGGLIGSIGLDTKDDINISNAHATGNVKLRDDQGGVGNTGGLVGYFTGRSASITDSSYTGNIDAPTGAYVGGLVGYLGSETTISGSYVSGSINGGREVGGLVGSSWNNGTTITSSYFNGRVTGAPGGQVGALIGSSLSTNIGSDVYYNTDGASAAVGFKSLYGQTTDNSRGLSGDQVKDMAYYANGTINQVLAARAEAAFRADGVRTGSTAATGSDVSSSGGVTSGTAASIKAMQQTAKLDAVDDDLKQTERKVRDDDERREKERKAAAARANRGGGSGQGGFGATIRSIDVDGQRFNLEGDGKNNGDGNGAAAPAPGGAQ